MDVLMRCTMKLFNGDCLEIMKDIPDESCKCCTTILDFWLE